MTNADANEDRLKGLTGTRSMSSAQGPLPWETKPSTPVEPSSVNMPAAATDAPAAPMQRSGPEAVWPATTSAAVPGAAKAVSLPAAIGLGFRGYIDFRGRASRSMFWWWMAFYYAVLFLAVILDGVLQAQSSDPVPILTVVAFLGLVIPTFMVTFRRLHDANRRAWWYLIFFVPLAGPIIYLVFMCERGTAGPNRFGPDPLL